MKLAFCVATALALALAADPALARGSRGGGGGGGRASGGGGRSGGGHAVSRGGGAGHSGYAARGGGRAGGSTMVSRGGGSGYARYAPRGGARPGGGYAVPRGSGGGRPGYAPAARGSAQARHPRAGTGYGSYHYGYPSYGHGGRYYGGHYGGSYGHYYRPYYGGYYGHYRPYYGGYYGYGGPYFGLYWGSPSVSAYFGWPYAYGSPYWSSTYTYAAAPYEDPGGDARIINGGEVETRGTSGYATNSGRVRLEVRPEDATVYVDDEFWGTASESRFITLRAGVHTIELVRPGFEVSRREVTVRPGATSDVLVELLRR